MLGQIVLRKLELTLKSPGHGMKLGENKKEDTGTTSVPHCGKLGPNTTVSAGKDGQAPYAAAT